MTAKLALLNLQPSSLFVDALQCLSVLGTHLWVALLSQVHGSGALILFFDVAVEHKFLIVNPVCIVAVVRRTFLELTFSFITSGGNGYLFSNNLIFDGILGILRLAQTMN